jgi:16S rRNA (guanine527-N7)-methyltransferase
VEPGDGDADRRQTGPNRRRDSGNAAPEDPDLGSDEEWRRLAHDLGIDLTADQVSRLRSFGAWLAEEALPAGGIGPGESTRLFDRHLADSLTFLAAIPARAQSLLDVGSGAGLPGIPIAIARPDMAVTLVDRSDRRTWLMRRALRVLDLDVAVVTGAVETITGPTEVTTFRGALDPYRAAELVGSGRLGPTVGVLGLSRDEVRPSVPDPPAGVALDVVRFDSGVLDSPSWLLRMRTAQLSV